MDKEIKLTPKGFEEVKSELNKLRDEDRPRIIQAIKDARSQGDLSENADYDAARNEQAKVEARIKELEYLIEHAVIIDANNDKNVVGIGSTVTIKIIDDDEEETYSIVGSLEADPFDNKISDESPIGKSLVGSKVGEVVSIVSPNGSYDVQIISIN